MRKTDLLKNLFLLTAFVLSAIQVSAQCDYTFDIQSEPETGATWVRELTTSSTGWSWMCANINTRDDAKAVELNGGGTNGNRRGYLVSPVLSGGCSSVSFRYSQQYDGTEFVVDIKQGDEIVWTRTVTDDTSDWTAFVADDLTIEGDYQLVITNTSSDSRNVGYFVTLINDICLTSVTGELSVPAVTLSGIEHTEEGFWDRALVTLSASGNASVYYTLDGTEPTESAELYYAPFEINTTATVKAIAIANDTQSELLDTLIQITATAFRFVVPEGAHVFVGEKSSNVTVAGNYLKKHYVPFEEKYPVYIDDSGENTIYAYNVSGKHNYRVSKEGALTHVGVFTPNASNKELTFTDEQLSSRSPKEVDYDVNNLGGRNMADIFLNINAQGYLSLPLDTTFQLVNLRNWQAIDSDVNNYFIEPDFHYTVVNEQGDPDNSVVTISPTGALTPVGAGKAIVLVTYDAMLCAHTTNVGNNGAAFFGAIWPQNTGVFVVSIDAPASDIKTNMTIGEYWNSDGTDKVDSVFIDAEHDVLYYEASTGGFDYTFKPEGVSSVALAKPVIGQNILSYNGFSTDGVTANRDGSYTVRLVHGRSIVRLTSASGDVEYQVLTAKPVTYTISNVTSPGELLQPGDEVGVTFNTLYHPSNKLSGIYNMSAGIQYTGFDTEFPLILGPGQYTFASRAQEYRITIPADYTGEEFVLTNGVIKVRGFGSYYGEHRNITLQNGVAPNLNAGVRTAFFGSLPDIYIRMTDKPGTPGNLQADPDFSDIVLSWTASVDNIGIEGYTIYVDGQYYGTTSKTTYTVSGLTGGRDYLLEVEAFDEAGNKSDRASVRESVLITGLDSYAAKEFSVYPNPFADYIVAAPAASGEAVIYDLSGKAVLNVHLQAGSNHVDTQALERGSYLMKFGEHVIKIVK